MVLGGLVSMSIKFNFMAFVRPIFSEKCFSRHKVTVTSEKRFTKKNENIHKDENAYLFSE